MSDLSRYEPIAEAIARLFQPYVEVVLHDIRRNRIAAIFNSFSQRKPGDDSLIEDAQGLARSAAVHGPYDEKRGADGRRIRYVSSVLRDDRGEAAGLMCINFDVSVLGEIHGAIEGLLSSTADSAEFDQLFADDWQVRINAFVREYLQEKSRALSSLRPAERAELVAALHGAGAFRAKNAANHVADVLGISRATVYKYLSKESDGRTETDAKRRDDKTS